MAEDRDQDRPSLEPPSLFGRRKRRPRPTAAPPPADTTAPVAQPVAAPVTEPATEPVGEPVAEPVPAPRSEPEPAVDDSPTTILDVDEPTVPAPPAPPPSTRPVAPTSPPVAAPVAQPSLPEPAAAEEPARPRPPREPWVTGRPAAVLTGLLVGALIVFSTAGALRGCRAVKGTSSCGGPGFFLLVAILIVAVLAGAALLRAARVPEPGSTSFLAVGLLSVVALLFLVGQLFEWWMIIVIPLVSVATFLVSHWVTTTYIDPADHGSDADRQPEPHDVR